MAGNEFDTPGFVEHLAAYQNDIAEGDRRIVAIAGPPGSGKTTLASELERQLNDAAPGSCVVLPMDGYHYDDEVLTPRGWQARKGAPHTFDVGGLAAILRRLQAKDEDTVAVPRFDRTIEIARAGAILIEQSARLIVIEGNWLLLAEAPWDGLAPYFDKTAMISVGLEELERRNRQRWIDFDFSEAAIRAKLEDNDMPNVRLVYERSVSPDWIIRP